MSTERAFKKGKKHTKYKSCTLKISKSDDNVGNVEKNNKIEIGGTDIIMVSPILCIKILTL